MLKSTYNRWLKIKRIIMEKSNKPPYVLGNRILLPVLSLEESTATHSSILVWRIPWAEESGGLQCMGSSDTTEVT